MTVLWGSLAAIFTGWPFCSLLFLPYGSYFLIVKKPSVSLKLIYCIQSALILCSILLTCSVIDFHMYGKTTSPLWNILQYNAIGGKGDELYGVEPAAYYIRNLFLTMGIAWPLASVAPILILCSLLLKIKSQKEFQNEMHQLVLCAPVILWLALLFRRPHKVSPRACYVYKYTYLYVYIMLILILGRAVYVSHLSSARVALLILCRVYDLIDY
jgi:hypothetical protein